MTKFLLCVTFLLNLNHIGWSQSKVLDSLNSVLNAAESDTARVSILIQISNAQHGSSYEDAKTTAQKAANLARSSVSDWHMAKTHEWLGKLYYDQKDINLALASNDTAISSLRKLGLLAESMEILHESGKIQFYAGLYDEAGGSFKEILNYRKEQTDTSEMIISLSWLAVLNNEINRQKEAINYATIGYELSIASGDLLKASACINSIGISYRTLGQPLKALKYYEEGYQLATELDLTRHRILHMKNVGIIHSDLGNYVRSLEAYLEARRLLETDERLSKNITLDIDIGIIYKKNGEYEKALNSYERGLKFYKNRADTSAIALCYQNLGNVYIELKQYDSARRLLFKAYNIVNNSHRKIFKGEAGALGGFFERIGVLDSAKMYLEIELKSIEVGGNQRHLAGVTHLLGRIHEKLGERDKAYSYFNRTWKAANDAGYVGGIKDAAEALYGWHKSSGNPSKALEYLEVFQKSNDSLFNQENTRKLAWTEANFQMEKVSDSLNWERQREAQILNRKIDKERERMTLIVLIAIAIIVISVLYYLFSKKQRQLKYDNEIALERNKGFKAVMVATEEERKRIAKDLHDGVVQQIGAIKLGLSRLQAGTEGSETDEIEHLKTMVDTAAEETRNLSHQMMPKVLIEMGLVDAIKEVIENTLVEHGFGVNFDEFGLQERYADSVEIAIYRIFQELVNNIVKHSKADAVEVQLLQNGNKLILIVEDNGAGMSSSSTGGIGLSNIKSRLVTIDGKVDYSSGPENGTVATIVIPL